MNGAREAQSLGVLTVVPCVGLEPVEMVWVLLLASQYFESFVGSINPCPCKQHLYGTCSRKKGHATCTNITDNVGPTKNT